MNNSESLPFLPNLCTSRAILVLVLVGELLAVALVTGESGLRHFDWARLAVVSFMVQWVGLSSAAALCVLRQYLHAKSALINVVVSYAVILLITLFVAILGQILLFGREVHELDGWQTLEALLLSGIFAGILLRYFYLQWQLQNQRQAELQSRLQALQSRIRPHFLFNSMNSIASLIAVDPDTAERVVEDLSELFRASLAEPNLIPLERELELARGYLNIEQLRMGDRLNVQWQTSNLPDDVTIPSLLLQPLLENAIYHGIQPNINGGDLNIAVTAEKTNLLIIVRNPVLTNTTTEPGHGIALNNIQHRLSAYYGADSTFQRGQYRSEGGCEYVVRITLPLHSQNHKVESL